MGRPFLLNEEVELDLPHEVGDVQKGKEIGPIGFEPREKGQIDAPEKEEGE